MTTLTHKRAKVNGVTLHYVTAGSGPTVLCMHGWPQNHREFLPVIEGLAEQYAFIAPDLRGYADSDKPYDGYEPKTIAEDMLALLDVEDVENFHILSHDLGGPPSVALAYLASNRAVSLATIETPFFGLNYPGYVDPRVPYWHLGMHMNMDITRLLVEGREEQYLRHFFRDFAYNPTAVPESEVQQYVMHMRQPGSLRASLNHYGYIPQMAAQTAELTKAHADCADAGLGRPRFLRRSLLQLRKGDRRFGRWRCHRGMRTLGLRREDRLHPRAAQQLLGKRTRVAQSDLIEAVKLQFRCN